MFEYLTSHTSPQQPVESRTLPRSGVRSDVLTVRVCCMGAVVYVVVYVVCCTRFDI